MRNATPPRPEAALVSEFKIGNGSGIRISNCPGVIHAAQNVPGKTLIIIKKTNHHLVPALFAPGHGACRNPDWTDCPVSCRSGPRTGSPSPWATTLAEQPVGTLPVEIEPRYGEEDLISAVGVVGRIREALASHMHVRGKTHEMDIALESERGAGDVIRLTGRNSKVTLGDSPGNDGHALAGARV